MSSQAATTDTPAPAKASFMSNRLGSLLAFLPLTFWVVNHLWDNLAAARGAQAWQEAVTGYKHPVAQVFTYVLVFGPLLWHTAWGVGRLFSARPNNVAYKFYGNVKYTVQRLSALGLLAFLGAHIYQAWLKPRFLDDRGPEQFADLAAYMHHHAPTTIVYALGVLAVAYHIANGLQGFAMGWGILASEKSMRRFEPWSILVFLVLLGLGWGAIWMLYQAGAAFPAPLEH